MARYIDADMAFEVLTDYYHQRTLIQRESLKEALGRVPTADVVEVVRCKDCVNCDHLVYKYDRNEEWWCGGLEVVPDGFCNYGERKEDAEIH